jgi:3-deoxy-D-manno-octulosonic-acid transferase
LHAVSVGEVLSSAHLIRELRRAIAGAPVFVSCSTLAGREAAEAKLLPLVDGIFYAPLDYVFAVRRVLRTIRPAAVVVLETEIWPNLYREVKRSGAALVVVNGRISDKTVERYTRWRALFRHVLCLPDAILAQSEGDEDRYIRAGAPAERVRSAGNLKYDFDPGTASPPAAVTAFLDQNAGPVWIAASTVAPEYDGDIDEDDAVIDAYRILAAEHPGLTLLIAPRRPERFEAVAAKLLKSGIPYQRRSQLPGPPTPVLLLDSIGELSSLFPRADVVFMGGTLADRGGHNILEPAIFARPIIAGPHLENFAAIEQHFVEADAFVRIPDASHLAPAAGSLLRDEAARRAIGERARQTAESERGATSRAVGAIVEFRWAALPNAIPYAALKPLAWMWAAGGRWKRRQGERAQRTLSVPVISVGGIAMGGVGKTPFAAHLARRLKERGYQPGILTRGYRRVARERVTVLAPGSEASTEITGDEAQILLNTGAASVGISADRYAAGTELEKRFHPDVLLLDDGFQHARLHRDLDIVLLDGLDPFAGGAVFPAGRLREPEAALARAQAVVISRAAGRQVDVIVNRIRRVNRSAAVFISSVQPIAWHGLCSREPLPLDSLAGERTVAFCGLANPNTFWNTAAELRCDIAARFAFADHHRYTEGELRQLAAAGRETGSSVLITTQKDYMNLPARAGEVLKDVRVCWLSIGISIEDEAEFLALVENIAGRRRKVNSLSR